MYETVRMRLATTHPLSAYGGVQLSRDALEHAADTLSAGDTPMQFNHDPTTPIHAVIIDTGVEQLEDGHWALWCEAKVDSADWAFVKQQFESAGVVGGMSISGGELLPGQPDAALIRIAADAAWYPDETLLEAASAFEDSPVQVSRLYQFSAIPHAAVIVLFAVQVLQQVPAALLASMIADSLRGLFSKAPGNITVRATRSKGKSKTIVRARPANRAEFEAVMKQLPQLLANLDNDDD